MGAIAPPLGVTIVEIIAGVDLISCLGWILFGLIAGGIAGIFVPGRNPGGCAGTVIIGILGALVGGWLVNFLGLGTPASFLGSLVVAVIGAVIVLVILRALGLEA
jgi:uncharacterized membrane protein YeaQ/YmgE (transglycosylase-associated protein family)